MEDRYVVWEVPVRMLPIQTSCRTSEKNPRGIGWRSFRCRFDLVDWFVGVAT